MKPTYMDGKPTSIISQGPVKPPKKPLARAS